MIPTLEQLLDVAEKAARDFYRVAPRSALSPVYHIVKPDGHTQIIAIDVKNKVEEQLAYEVMRLHMRQLAAVAYCFSSEGWSVELKPGEEYHGEVRKHPRAKEVVTLAAVSKEGDVACRFFFVSRDRKGLVEELVRRPDEGGLHFAGRITNLLSYQA